MAASLVAVSLAWVAGIGSVAAVWPRRESLPALAWLGLAGLVGPCVIGGAFMLTGLLGLRTIAVPLSTIVALALGGFGVWRRRSSPRPAAMVGAASLSLVLAVAVVWTSALGLRTHLGWDGTVVWLHKARVLAATGGVMPVATLADRTRSWTAPDYPLHVPLAMAWVLRWQAVEDERHLKVLPAAWYAAILCLVAAAVCERTPARDLPVLRAAVAVLVIATAPRLLVGEGSLTSGYGDGAVAGLLAALSWVAWRSRWAGERDWQPLLALLATCLAWTKQEGVLAVAAIACVCAWQQRTWRASGFAWPALVIAASWQALVTGAGAPVAMAYTYVGVGPALARLPAVVGGYAAELGDVRSWGVFWPVLAAQAATIRVTGAGWCLGVLVATLGGGALTLLFSAWPDVSAHVAVTAGRQLIQVAPALVVVVASSVGRTSALESTPGLTSY